MNKSELRLLNRVYQIISFKLECGHLTKATLKPRRNIINEFTPYTYHLKHYPIDFNDNSSNCKTIKLSRLVN